MIAETMPEPIRMPKCGINQLPIKAPTMPTAMSPITPNPPPATILPASQPATSPTNRMTRRPCPEMYIAPPQALLGNSLAPDNPQGNQLVPEFCAMQSHVRFGSKADISQCNRHVRFTPESGHFCQSIRFLVGGSAKELPKFKTPYRMQFPQIV